MSEVECICTCARAHPSSISRRAGRIALIQTWCVASNPLDERLTQVRCGVHLHVRTCTPPSNDGASSLARPSPIKASYWLYYVETRKELPPTLAVSTGPAVPCGGDTSRLRVMKNGAGRDSPFSCEALHGSPCCKALHGGLGTDYSVYIVTKAGGM